MDAYQRYGRALLRKAERILQSRAAAEDVVQALFVDLLGKDDAVQDLPYLYRAVTNRCLALVRDEANRARLLAEHDEALRGPVRTSLEAGAEGADFLHKLMARLDEDVAEVLVYHVVDDMTQEEIASLLGVSRKTIGARLGHVRDEARRLADADRDRPSEPGAGP